MTERLVLRPFTPEDAGFILRLVNDPDWLRHIGDKGVRTLDDSRAYIENGPLESYRCHGFGLALVALREGGTPIGICGLIKRDTLEDIDLGFAFLPEFRSQGYATEAALATIDYGRRTLKLHRLAAITSPGNHASTRLLRKLGFRFESFRQLAEGTPEVEFHVASL